MGHEKCVELYSVLRNILEAAFMAHLKIPWMDKPGETGENGVSFMLS